MSCITKIMFVVLTLILSTHIHARDRIALVIGNADYRLDPLKNPVHDAQDIAGALNELNFDVTVITNANQDQMESAILAFGDKLHENSVGLFYYAGHGVQYQGRNYLIPIDAMARVSVPDHLRYKTVDAGYVLGLMEQSGSGLNIVLLDACRNSPFKSFSRSMDRGLARMSGAEGTLIAYSTAPGQIALDGEERNSPYTAELINLMRQPNLPIELMLKQVRAKVKANTNGLQSPWYEASIDGNFYFSEKAKAEKTEPKKTAVAQPKQSKDLIFIPLLNATVTSMRFYEGGYDNPNRDDRAYKESFQGSNSRYIYWELNLSFPKPGQEVKFPIHAIYYNSDGTVKARVNWQASIQPDWTWSSHSKGWGNKTKGKTWQPGLYKVELYIQGKYITESSFEVY